MPRPEITPVLIRALWTYLSEEFNSEIAPKQQSKLMTAAGSFLDTIGVLNKQKFLENYVTTIHRTIYTPFEIGDPTTWSLRSQMRLAVHEHQHIVQGDREGWLSFDARYLASRTARAAYEAEAFGAEMELEVYLDATIDLATFANRRVESLRNYACDDKHISMARQILLMRAPITMHGIVETKATNKAIRWLQQYNRNGNLQA